MVFETITKKNVPYFDFASFAAGKLAARAPLAVDGQRGIPRKDYFRRAGLLFRLNRYESRQVLILLEQRGLVRQDHEVIIFLNDAVCASLIAESKPSRHASSATAISTEFGVLNHSGVASP